MVRVGYSTYRHRAVEIHHFKKDSDDERCQIVVAVCGIAHWKWHRAQAKTRACKVCFLIEAEQAAYYEHAIIISRDSEPPETVE